jgi:hypothetical protein
MDTTLPQFGRLVKAPAFVTMLRLMCGQDLAIASQIAVLLSVRSHDSGSGPYPTAFEYAINLKTAAAINLTVPAIVLTGATRVFE